MIYAVVYYVCSGCLVAYLTLCELKKCKGKLNWLMYYFHRFWRYVIWFMYEFHSWVNCSKT